MFGLYALYVLLFTATMLLFEPLFCSDTAWQQAVGWSMMGYSAAYTALLLVYEARQACQEGRKYFSDAWNVIDSLGIGCTAVAIVLQILAVYPDSGVSP
eukprot:COSAG01_NODE_38254_length_492_cov_0.521628_1_plen_98_part_01